MGRTMISLAHLPTDSDIEVLAYRVNDTFQRISADLPKQKSTHQHPPSMLLSSYSVRVQDVEKKLFNVYPAKAIGTYDIPNWVYHDFDGLLGKPTAAFFISSEYKNILCTGICLTFLGISLIQVNLVPSVGLARFMH